MKVSGTQSQKISRVVFTALFALLPASLSHAYYDGTEPKVSEKPSQQQLEDLKDVGLEQKIGTTPDLGALHFKDENGQDVTLADYFKSGKPVLMSPVYFTCPGLCNYHLNGLTDGLKEMDWSIGDKFTALAISFDPRETPADALKKKELYLKTYGRPEAAAGWHFLTGDAENVKKFTEAVGFKYKWNAKEKDWSHPSTAIVLDSKGRISRYMPGISFKGQDIKLALNEATQGKIGTVADALVLYCYQYNPNQNKYTLYAANIMKMGGAGMVLVLAMWLLPAFIRSRNSGAKAARS